MELSDWRETYRRAWEIADEDLIASIFTEMAPDGRRTDLREYWHVVSGHREAFLGWGD